MRKIYITLWFIIAIGTGYLIGLLIQKAMIQQMLAEMGSTKGLWLFNVLPWTGAFGGIVIVLVVLAETE